MPISITIPEAKYSAFKLIPSPLIGEVVVVSFPPPEGRRAFVAWDFDDDGIGDGKDNGDGNYRGLRDALIEKYGTDVPVEIRLPVTTQNYFRSILETADIGDDQVSFELSNIDRSLTRLLSKYGYDMPVEIFYWLPEIKWLSSEWWGQLHAPNSLCSPRLTLNASVGFRSYQSIIPRLMRGASLCQRIFGGYLFNLDDIFECGCLYAKQLGGFGNNDPLTGLPYIDCGLTKEDCVARQGDDLNWGGTDTNEEGYYVSQSKGSPVLATVQGNDNRFREPFGIALGGRFIIKNIIPIAFRPETNNNHPDKAALSSLMPISIGLIGGATNYKVNNQFITAANLQVRYGEARQSTTGFSANTNKYSRIAVFYSNIFGDWRNLQADGVRGECEVTQGYQYLRVYTDENTFTRQNSTNPAWNIYAMYTDKLWGDGQNHSRFVKSDWINCAASSDETVSWEDNQGNPFTGKRAEFTWFLEGRATQQQIEDACLWAGYGIPFQHEGKIRIVPLLKEPDLTAVPVFTDKGEFTNIYQQGNGDSSVDFSIKDPLEMPYEFIVDFYDEAHEFQKRVLPFVARKEQLREGTFFGDLRFRQNPSPVTAVGVTKLGQAVRMGWRILDLGRFDSGGLKNNLTCTFQTSWKLWKAFNLHKYKVIKVDSYKADDLDESRRFSYFRIMNRKKLPGLGVEVTCQAYPEDYYESLEEPSLNVPQTAVPELTGARPGAVNFDLVSVNPNEIRFTLEAMAL